MNSSTSRTLAKLFDQAPPCAVEAEMATLGSCLLSSDAAAEAMEILPDSSVFYEQRHAVIYDAILHLSGSDGGCVDMVSMAQHLTDKRMLEQVGGVAYLQELFESVPSASNCSWYARQVAEKATVRKLIDAASKLLQSCYSGVDAADLIEMAGQSFFDAGEAGQQHESSAAAVIESTLSALEAREGTGLIGVPTGFDALDDKLNGLHDGEMIVIAARPSMGKTALMLNIAQNISLRGVPVGVFSLEMSKEQLIERMLCSEARVDSQKFRKNILKQEEFSRICDAASRLERASMLISDQGGVGIGAIRSRARRMVRRHGIKALFIDYLQLMSGPRSANRNEEMGEVSRQVKAMARELKIPVICLSQLNRASQQREGNKPRMSDLRESGSIEQDADVIMMVHREDYYHKDDPGYTNDHIAEIIIEKQRNGPVGTERLRWDGPTASFRRYGDRV